MKERKFTNERPNERKKMNLWKIEWIKEEIKMNKWKRTDEI